VNERGTVGRLASRILPCSSWSPVHAAPLQAIGTKGTGIKWLDVLGNLTTKFMRTYTMQVEA
jgi:hypothetical protein